MSKQTHLGTAILGAIYDGNINQETLAKEMRSTQASVSRLISGKNRPSRKIMRGLCTALKKKNHPQSVLVLIGHLEDEIEASGIPLSDINVTPARSDLDRPLDTKTN